MPTRTVHFLPVDRRIDVPVGTPLTVAAAEAGVAIRTDCGGNGTCGKCEVRVDGVKRLACRVLVERDMTVELFGKASGDVSELVVQTKALVSTGSVGARTGHRFGVALDIGTTTLAAELFDNGRFLGVVSRANPQRRFGDDVISRIQKVVEQPDSLGAMQAAIVEAVNGMLRELAVAASIRPRDITLLSVAGNTVMEYLFLGIDPAPLGFTPFEAPVSEFSDVSGRELGLILAPDGIVETMPIFGGFVGGDVVAGVLATGLDDATGAGQDGPVFLIDLGTNGELVLRHEGKKLYTAATAAGPAFEGGRIEFGTLAVPGAIDRVRLHDDGRIDVSTIGDRPATGICGSGLIDLAAEMLRCGLILPTGRFDVRAASPLLKHWTIVDGRPAFQVVPEGRSGLSEAILLTQRDVRQLQLAVGAIRAGIRLLLGHVGLSAAELVSLDVAGGFGSFVRPASARRLGLLPPEVPPDRVRLRGNTSLAGARLALLDPERRNLARSLARSATTLDLAAMPGFAEVFADAMVFPTESALRG